MQGRPLDERELLDAESVVGHLVGAGSVFALLAAHRRVLFPAAMFEDLFPGWRPIDLSVDHFEEDPDEGRTPRDPWPADFTTLYWWRPTFWMTGYDTP